MFKKLENKFFLVCAALVLVFNGMFYAFAEETETDPGETAVIVDGSDQQCASNVMVDAQVVVSAYQTFLDDYFKEVTPTSEQVEGAMKYYRFIEYSINKIYKRNLQKDVNLSLNNSLQASTYCAYIRDVYLDIAKAMMEKQVISSANSKRTFLVVDGLKAMNADMDTFSDQFNEVFPGYFNKFNNALPCYAHQCINK